MIRSASFLPIPGMATRTAWSWAMIASWRSGVGRDPTIASATFGPDPVDGQQQGEEPELLDRPEAVQRLLVLADQVVGVELERPARLRRGKDRWCREHAIPDPADLDDERVGRDGPDDSLDRRDHEAAARNRPASTRLGVSDSVFARVEGALPGSPPPKVRLAVSRSASTQSMRSPTGPRTPKTRLSVSRVIPAKVSTRSATRRCACRRAGPCARHVPRRAPRGPLVRSPSRPG